MSADDQQAAVPRLNLEVFGGVSQLERVKYGQQLTMSGVPNTPGVPAVEGIAERVLHVPQISKLGVMQVSLQLDRIRTLQSTNADVRARIRWGVGGASAEFFCDWADGGLINLVADELDVDAVPYAPDDDSPFNSSGLSTRLSACVGVGGNVNVPPQLTSVQRLLVPGAATTYSVPPYTRAVSIVSMAPAAPLVDPYVDLRLQLISLPATPFATFDGSTIAGGAAVPAANSVAATIVNVAAAATAKRVRAVFHLGA